MPLSKGKNSHLAQNYRFFMCMKGHERSFRDEGCLKDKTPSQVRAHLINKLSMNYTDPETGEVFPMFAACELKDLESLQIKAYDEDGNVKTQHIPGLIENHPRVDQFHRIMAERIPIVGRPDAKGKLKPDNDRNNAKAWAKAYEREQARRAERMTQAEQRLKGGHAIGSGTAAASAIQAQLLEKEAKTAAGAVRTPKGAE